ncbi:MAG: hypothetical protein FWD73_17450 [Polyangiaceae bacterium]|nr:hypothetical protein [Polyangiaceae bacterium]
MAKVEPKSAEQIRGIEYDWLGSDENGQVGLFSTAGAGYAPTEFLRDTDAHDAAIDAILGVRASTTAKFAPSLAPNLVNTWKLVAERGLYAFDCNPNGGSYRLIALPVVPIRIDALPTTVARVVSKIRLRFRFDTQTVISYDMLMHL